MANFIGFIGNLITQLGLWMIVGLMAPLFLYLIFVYKTDLKRLSAELRIERSSKILRQDENQEIINHELKNIYINDH